MEFLWIGIGGFFGAASRYCFYLLEKRFLPTLPLATFIVNLLGCLLAGILWGLIERKILINQELKLILMVGFLGSFTTFSTFSLETVSLIRTGDILVAIFNIAAQVFLGLLLVSIGQFLTTIGEI
jgi:fluoride exporter